jgi:hypothetical protein
VDGTGQGKRLMDAVSGRSPDAHRVRDEQVVGPDPATLTAETLVQGLIGENGVRPDAAGRNLGDDLLPAPSPDIARPTQTDALTCSDAASSTYRSCSDLIRDEEVVGSNPATPTLVRGPFA